MLGAMLESVGLDYRQVLASSATGALTALLVFLLLDGLRPRARGAAAPDLAVTEPRRKRRSREATVLDEIDEPPELALQESSQDEKRSVGKHTEDATLRATNAYLMQRGRAARSRQVGKRYGPAHTEVVRIALTGGPCAGKSSALDHLTRSATDEGFDVLTAPEVATLYFNASYQLPTPSSDNFCKRCAAGMAALFLSPAHTPLSRFSRRPESLHISEEHSQTAVANGAVHDGSGRAHGAAYDCSL